MSLTTNLARPKTCAIITVRVIKSFDFRTERSLVLRDINLETTTIGNLKTIVRDGDPPPTTCAVLAHSLTHPAPWPAAIQTQPGWKPYRSASLGPLRSETPSVTLLEKKEVH
jgi:hypothetical protein